MAVGTNLRTAGRPEVFTWGRIWIWVVAGLALATRPAFAQMSESFEYGVPPPGWAKTNLQGGSGWYQLPIGVMPLPGWGNGTSSVPATANAGTHNAYCSWTTGGGAAEGYHSDQWLISPRLTGLTATSTVSYWLRFNFTNFPDTVYFRVSTNGPAPANFTFVPKTNVFARASYTNQFPPWSNHVVNVGALGIPAGTPIWIAIQEYEWDNTWNGAAVQLDVINSDLTAPPEARVGPTSLTFTAYYEGSDPTPQTFALQGVGSSGMGYSRSLTFGAGGTNWLAVGGPASGTLGFQGSQTYTAAVSVAGLDSGTYVATNVFNVPGATNNPLRVPITFHVIRRPQAISFPNPGAQYTTNKVGLAGTSSSGLPVTFSVFSGPGSVAAATNLSFTGTGTVRVVAWQLGNAYYDVAPCVTNSLAVSKPNAAISFVDLSHVYDGAPHGATVTTVPAGLAVDTTYDGSPALPVAIGSYAVTSTVNDVMYGGTAVATFVITRMVQTLAFPNPGSQWITNSVGLAATASSGLPVTFSVASGPGSISGETNLAFTGIGTVDVVASQAGDASWLPQLATNSIEVAKALATVTLGDLSHVYDGTAKGATATTDPAGLAVDVTYDGNAWAPTNAGSYAVTGTVNEANWQGSSTGLLTVGKASATVFLQDLAQTYDGAARTATATTMPAGLTVEFTYDGSTTPPQAVGLYTVTGTVADANYEGSATGALTVAKGSATVTLENLSQTYDGTAKNATATTDPAGLAVDITYEGSTTPPQAAGSYAVTGTVTDANYEGGAAGTLTIGKASQSIGNFLPTNGRVFLMSDSIGLSATASSGLEVFFASAGGPAVLEGTNLTFSRGGEVLVFAMQAGDANWNAAPPVANAYSVLGIYSIAVESPHGTAIPGTGTFARVQGTVFTNRIETPDTQGTTQYVCIGWALDGHEPASGTEPQMTMTATNDATLRWLWTTNYQLTTASGGNGSVRPETGWMAAGVATQVLAEADPYFVFADWSGDAAGGDNPVSLTMDAAKSVTANFAALCTTNRPTPEWWLAEHGMTNEMESAVDDDPDGDGAPTGDEWVMDTDPTNGLSVLAFSQAEPVYGTNCWEVVWTNEEPYEVVTNLECEVIGYAYPWRTSTNRTYGVQWTSELHGPWTDLEGMSNLQPQGAELVLTNSAMDADRMRHYRIRVRVP